MRLHASSKVDVLVEREDLLTFFVDSVSWPAASDNSAVARLLFKSWPPEFGASPLTFHTLPVTSLWRTCTVCNLLAGQAQQTASDVASEASGSMINWFEIRMLIGQARTYLARNSGVITAAYNCGRSQSLIHWRKRRCRHCVPFL